MADGAAGGIIAVDFFAGLQLLNKKVIEIIATA